MKAKLIDWVFFILLLIATAFGCVMTPVDRVETIYNMSNAAADLGTYEYLMEQDEEKRGSKARVFESAAVALEILSDKETITVSDIARILKTLPIKELRSREAVLAIRGAEIAFSKIGVENKPTDMRKVNLKRLARELHIGIRSGMFAAIGVID